MRLWAMLSSVVGVTGAGVLAAVLLQFAPQPAPDIPDVLQIGRGTVEHIAWQPNSDVLLVTTIRGAWLYTETMLDIAHIEDARLARFSPDGALLAGVDAENNVRLWDGHTFAPQATLYRHTAPVIDLAWSPRGTQVATLDADGLITVYTLAAENPLTLLHLPGAASIKWSPGGTYLASMGETGTFVWSTDSELIFQNPFTSENYTWQNDEQLQVWYLGDGSDEKAWNITTGQEIDAYIGSEVAFSPDYSRVITSWYFGELFYYSLQNQEHDTEDNVFTEMNTSAMVWHPTQTYLAVAASNRDDTSQMKIYSYHHYFPPALIANWHFPYRQISQLAWREDMALAMEADGEVLVWDYASDTILGQRKEHGLIGRTWSPDGNRIVTRDGFNNLQLWDTKTGEQLATLTGSKQSITQLLWQPNGHLIAARSDLRDLYFPHQHPENRIFIWDTSQANGVLEPTHELAFGSPPVGMAWSPAGDELAIATHDTIYFWDVAQKDVSRQFQPYEGWLCDTVPFQINGLSWHPKAPRTITTQDRCGSGSASNWDAFTGELPSLVRPEVGNFTAWSINPTPLWPCMACPSERELHLTQIISNAGEVVLIREVILEPMAAFTVASAISPSQTAVYARDLFDTVAVWGLPDGQLRFTLPDVQGVRWTDDGQSLFVIDKQGQIFLVNAQTGARSVFPHLKMEPYLFLQNWRQDAYLHLNPDNTRLAYINEGVITIVNAQPE